jgi:hypothetical protein
MPSLVSSLEVAFKAAFAGFTDDKDKRQFADTFLGEIRTNWREAEKDLRRTIGTLILAAAVFQLTLASKPGDPATKITILGVEITDIRLVQIALPVIVAYLFSSICMLLSDIQLFADTHKKLYSLVYGNKFTQNGVQSLLDPPNASFVSLGRRQHFVESSFAQLLYPRIFWFKLIIVVAGPIVFEVYAYRKLLRQPSDSDPLVWASCVVTVIIMFLASSLLWGIVKGTGQDEPAAR